MQTPGPAFQTRDFGVSGSASPGRVPSALAQAGAAATAIPYPCKYASRKGLVLPFDADGLLPFHFMAMNESLARVHRMVLGPRGCQDAARWTAV